MTVKYKRVVIMTHQTVSLKKYWKLFQTTLTFALIVFAHPYCESKFTCHVMHRARVLSIKMIGQVAIAILCLDLTILDVQ